MSDDTHEPTSVGTRSQFNSALCDLLHSAREGDVDITGPWECRTSETGSDWEVTIVELVGDGDEFEE